MRPCRFTYAASEASATTTASASPANAQTIAFSSEVHVHGQGRDGGRVVRRRAGGEARRRRGHHLVVDRQRKAIAIDDLRGDRAREQIAAVDARDQGTAQFLVLAKRHDGEHLRGVAPEMGEVQRHRRAERANACLDVGLQFEGFLGGRVGVDLGEDVPGAVDVLDARQLGSRVEECPRLLVEAPHAAVVALQLEGQGGQRFPQRVQT
jgi:hypothetical protein